MIEQSIIEKIKNEGSAHISISSPKSLRIDDVFALLQQFRLTSGDERCIKTNQRVQTSYIIDVRIENVPVGEQRTLLADILEKQGSSADSPFKIVENK